MSIVEIANTRRAVGVITGIRKATSTGLLQKSHRGPLRAMMTRVNVGLQRDLGAIESIATREMSDANRAASHLRNSTEALDSAIKMTESGGMQAVEGSLARHLPAPKFIANRRPLDAAPLDKLLQKAQSEAALADEIMEQLPTVASPRIRAGAEPGLSQLDSVLIDDLADAERAVVERMPVKQRGVQRLLDRLGYTKNMHFVGLKNLPADGNYILAPLHVAMTDPLIAGRAVARDIRFMAKDGLFSNRRFGEFLRDLGAMPVTRGDSHSDVRIAEALLRDKQTLVLYPEGLISRFDTASMPRHGAALLGLKTGVPIVPAATWGNGSKGIHDSGGIFSKIFRPKVVMAIGKPIETAAVAPVTENLAATTSAVHDASIGQRQIAREAYQQIFK